jgi:4-carboxymuconolactone decarboxylase
MTTLEERYQKGIETRTKFGAGTPRSGWATESQLAPDLYRIIEEALFGSIWHRPGMKIEHREMCTLTVLTVLQKDNQIRRHTGNALNLGLLPEQIIEVFIHAAFYSGVPSVLNTLEIAKEVFAERGIDFTPPRIFDPTETPDDLFERGVARRQELMGEPSGTALGPVTQAEREFNRLTTEYYWGSVWNRPGLDLQSRSMCTLAALTALGRHGPLRSHIRGALNIGLTQEQIVEVFIHTTFYCGLPFAREAIDIANEIFRESQVESD